MMLIAFKEIIRIGQGTGRLRVEEFKSFINTDFISSIRRGMYTHREANTTKDTDMCTVTTSNGNEFAVKGTVGDFMEKINEALIRGRNV